ncbi:flagellar basal body L-ring protein FlgH [Sphaerotilus uruguayifluvii]|uniref:Flagellar L-ring protein n=1 Tax=Sphaerotilus uruguayifluvii TaxID=2735897 RepID=A0ABX2G706_9BURK|nr:flagellar L-ring protein precursor FlgH [Leptothrix sp. C29]
MSAGRRSAGAAAVLLLAQALAGCQSVMPTVARVDMPEPVVVRPYAQPVPMRTNGSIYQASQYRPLFEDHRARLVGDTITVQIIERVSASSNSTSTVEKKGELSGSITALPMLSANSFARAGVGGSSANTFSGKGGTQNSNNFSGTITATVVEVLPNGHLVIAGEKQIGVNDSVDVLRFSGQIDPRAIQPGNQVASAQIANVRVEQKGRGGQADAQQIGWLSRFFLNLMPI